MSEPDRWVIQFDLDSKEVITMPQGSVFDALRQEHVALNTQLHTLVMMVKSLPCDGAENEHRRCYAQVQACRKAFLAHRGHEEVALFPDVEQLIADPKLPLDIMRAFFVSEGEDDIGAHLTVQQHLQELDRLLDPTLGPDAKERLCMLAQKVSDQLSRHMAKEEHVVFATAERLLTPEQLTSLTHRCQDAWTALDTFL